VNRAIDFHDQLSFSAVEIDNETVNPVLAAKFRVAKLAIPKPLIVVLVAPESSLVPIVSVISLVFLALLGVFAARAGGSPVLRAAVRVTFWGALAMGSTAVVGALFGTIV